ncbi:MAG TPA: hypothetical protein VNU01_04610 [Egibacteraceae bacterium]|nr:hypothetical protein [Egibacteraceae bacterium]
MRALKAAVLGLLAATVLLAGLAGPAAAEIDCVWIAGNRVCVPPE